MATHAERYLQREIMTLLQFEDWKVIAIPIPNGVWIPARTDIERQMVARIIHRMKTDGEMEPGAPDIVLLWADGSACVELKRPATKELFGTRARGRLSPAQKHFAKRCGMINVRYVNVESWDELRSHLIHWGIASSRRY